MEDCTKSTKRIAGNVVKTGEEAAPAVEAEASNASLSSKKTKLTSQEVKLPSLENGDSFVVSPHKTSSTSDSVSENFSTSRSSSDDVIKSADLKVNFKLQMFKIAIYYFFFSNFYVIVVLTYCFQDITQEVVIWNTEISATHAFIIFLLIVINFTFIGGS